MSTLGNKSQALVHPFHPVLSQRRESIEYILVPKDLWHLL